VTQPNSNHQTGSESSQDVRHAAAAADEALSAGGDINSEGVDTSLDQAMGPLWARVLAPLPLPLLRGVGRAAGYLLYALAAKRRRIVAVNLALCFPERTPAQR
jgi:hypothetical protein